MELKLHIMSPLFPKDRDRIRNEVGFYRYGLASFNQQKLLPF